MNKKNMTALISCFARAYHTKNYKFKIFNDPISEILIGKNDYDSICENMVNGISFFNPTFNGTKEEALRYIVDNQLSPSILGRSIFSEKALMNSRKLGVKQYVIFACGYDTSFYRNKDLKVFELDKQQIINDKKERLNKNNIDYSNIEFIEADFIEDNWIDSLEKSDFDKNQKAFCSMLGISYYLSQEQFEKFMRKVSKLLITGSEIVLDYPTYDESQESKINQELAKSANEEMKSKYSFEDIERICENNNMLVYENLDSDDMTNNHFYNYNILNPNNKIIAPKGVAYCLLVKR